jgi:rod shape-determining protein MreD
MVFLFFLAMVLQWWLSTNFLVFDLTPRLLLVLTVVISARMGSVAGMSYGFAWGLYLDVLRAHLFGANALAYTLIAYTTGAIRRQIDVVGIGSQAAAVLLMSWGYFLLYALLGLIFMKTSLFPGWKIFFLNPFYNALMVPLVFVFWERFMAVRR